MVFCSSHNLKTLKTPFNGVFLFSVKQDVINEYVANDWELQQVVSPNDLGGALVGLFYKEQD